MKLGIDVYRPVVEGGRYDLVSASARASFASSASGPADAEASLQSGVPRVAGPRDGLLHRTYKASEIDAIAAYCPETERCYLLPSALVAGRRELSLRLDPTRNGQKVGIRWADDFESRG